MKSSKISYLGSILIGNNRRKMSPILFVVLVIICTQLEFANAAVLNRTDQYYIVQVPVEELETLRQARQQQNTTPHHAIQITSSVFAGVNQILNGLGFNEHPRPIVVGSTAVAPVGGLREGVSVSARVQQNTSEPDPVLLPEHAFAGVNQILTGLFNEDVRPIVTGTSALIPVGGIREGVSALLQNISPTIQNILFGPNANRTFTVQPITPRTSVTDDTPPTHIQVIIQLDSDSKVDLNTAAPTTQPTTTPIPTTTPEPETTGHTFPIIIKYRIPSRNRTKATTTPSPAAIPEQSISIKEVRPGPGQVLLFFRHPHETYSGSPQVSNSETRFTHVPNSETRFPPVPKPNPETRPPQVPVSGSRFPQSSSLPESSKISSHLPDSPRAGISHNIGDINAYLPGSPPAPVVHAEIKNIIEAPDVQYLKVVEEEPVFIPSTTTEKDYIYLVLQSSEYDKFVKYTNQNRYPITTHAPPTHPPVYEAVVVNRENDQPQQSQPPQQPQQSQPPQQPQEPHQQLQQLQLQQLHLQQQQLQLQLHNLQQQATTVGSIVPTDGPTSPPTPSNSSTIDPDPNKVDEDDDDEDERITVTDVLAAILTER